MKGLEEFPDNLPLYLAACPATMWWLVFGPSRVFTEPLAIKLRDFTLRGVARAALLRDDACLA